LPSLPNPGYHQNMGKVKKVDFDEPTSILEEEDEATLAAIDRGVKAADEGRVVPLEKVRQRMKTWLTKSPSPKTH
jgi:hypothetical protein